MIYKIAEKTVQSALAHYYRTQLGASVLREVKTPVGYIDLIVHEPRRSRLIEVKEVKSIKHAIGQVVNYAKFRTADIMEIVYFNRNLSDNTQPHAALYGHTVELAGQLPKTIQLTNITSLISTEALISMEKARAVVDTTLSLEEPDAVSLYYNTTEDFTGIDRDSIDW